MNQGNKNLKVLILIVILAVVTSNFKKKDTGPDPNQVASCEGCHTNYAHLQSVYTPDTTKPSGGCGGEAPHYEPYDRVYLGGTGFTDFKNSSHYTIGCVGCHNGTDGTDNKNLAHSGNFIAHPSAYYTEKCGSCHEEIVNRFPNSIHHGYGQMRKIAIRSGLDSYKDFDKLPQHQIEGYNANCATCHGTCGNCHVVRPLVGGGGLTNGHKFIKTPDMISICVACHISRGGHAYLGMARGTHVYPDGFDDARNQDSAATGRGLDLHVLEPASGEP